MVIHPLEAVIFRLLRLNVSQYRLWIVLEYVRKGPLCPELCCKQTTVRNTVLFPPRERTYDVIEDWFLWLVVVPVLFPIFYRNQVVHLCVSCVSIRCICVGMIRLCSVCVGDCANCWHQSYSCNRHSVRNAVLTYRNGMNVAVYEPIRTVRTGGRWKQL